ncbi:MAG TPA: glutamyl-tRNA reductase [Nitrospirae bacterium]|nr:glutamyl-tRNA reductase [Nitrospirota bacterium]
MNIIVLGLNHKTASVEVREKIAFSGTKLEEGLMHFSSISQIKETAILSTCNRVEVYFVVDKDNADEAIEKIQDVISIVHNIEKSLFLQHLYNHRNKKAVKHIFRVASSLDSMIVGEPQILGQLKDAFDLSLKKKTTGVILNKLITHAIYTAKRVRTETKIAENAVSISFAAVEMAKKIFISLTEKRVMLIGAGEMAELAARHLINNGVSNVIVANRTFERGCELANLFNGKVVKFEDFQRELVNVDIVICSTGASSYIINKEQMHKIMKERKNKPVFIIDISVPRNVAPDINDIDNVYLYDVDDLQDVVYSNINNRKKEAEKAENIVSEEVESFINWIDSLQVTPTVIALKKKAEEIRDDEFQRFKNKYPNLNEDTLKAIHYMGTAIINKLIHPPIIALKEHGNESTQIVEFTKKLYDL